MFFWKLVEFRLYLLSLQTGVAALVHEKTFIYILNNKLVKGVWLVSFTIFHQNFRGIIRDIFRVVYNWPEFILLLLVKPNYCTSIACSVLKWGIHQILKHFHAIMYLTFDSKQEQNNFHVYNDIKYSHLLNIAENAGFHM